MAASSEMSPEPEKPTFSSRGRMPSTPDATAVAFKLGRGGVVDSVDGALEVLALAGGGVVGSVDGPPDSAVTVGVGVVGPVGNAPDTGSCVRTATRTRIVNSAELTTTAADLLIFTGNVSCRP